MCSAAEGRNSPGSRCAHDRQRYFEASMSLAGAVLWMTDSQRAVASFPAMGMRTVLSYAGRTTRKVYIGECKESLEPLGQKKGGWEAVIFFF